MVNFSDPGVTNSESDSRQSWKSVSSIYSILTTKKCENSQTLPLVTTSWCHLLQLDIPCISMIENHCSLDMVESCVILRPANNTWYLSFFSLTHFKAWKFYTQVRKFATKTASQQNSVNLRHKLPRDKIAQITIKEHKFTYLFQQKNNQEKKGEAGSSSLSLFVTIGSSLLPITHSVLFHTLCVILHNVYEITYLQTVCEITHCVQS